jgi:hypothetical protein
MGTVSSNLETEIKMIEVRYKARLGNNLFQYSLGRILAEELGFALEAQPIPGFSGTLEKISGKKYETPEEVLTEYRIEFDRLRTDPTARKIVLNGWFQRYEYYRPFRRRIQDWLQPDVSLAATPADDDLVINVRRTDYVTLGWALPFSYYEEAIERAGAKKGRLWIVTDAPKDPFFQRFKAWRPRFVCGSALEDLAFMMRARRLVVSQSTFCWWAAFLGNPEEVYAPLPQTGIWAGNTEGDTANLIERDRFVCIECQENYQPNLPERLHQKSRRLQTRLIAGLNRRFGLSLKVPIT